MEKIFQALNAGDDMVEDSASSLTVNPAEFKQSGDVPSLEDVNWADSCLVNDAEESDPKWAFLLDALAEALSSHPDAPASRASKRYTLTEGIDIAITPTGKETEPSVSLETAAFDSASIPAKELENNSDKYPINDQSDTSPLETTNENVFLPTYKEGTREVDDFDAEFDTYFPVYVMEPRNENIFQEWDIDIPDVEDELTKQLDKILSGVNTSQSDPLNFDDTGVWEVSRGRSIDDLVAGLIDLSIDDLNSGVSDLSLNGQSA